MDCVAGDHPLAFARVGVTSWCDRESEGEPTVLRRHAWLATGMLVLGGSMALVPMATASAKGGVAALNCPKQSVISSAAGTTFKGPSKDNGGTAACIYTDAAGNSLNVVTEAPSESRSKFVSTDPGDIGKPATAVPGIGKAAFSTTTFGHAEVDVYESSSKGFAVTLDPANQAAVTPADLVEVKAVAHAIANG
jgi:hypothetical protein